MALPNYRYFIPAVFEALRSLPQPVRRRDLVNKAAEIYGLTPDERREVTSGGRLRYLSRTGFALNALRCAGIAEAVSRGVWQLTSRGRELVSKHPSGLPDNVVKDIDRERQRDENSSARRVVQPDDSDESEGEDAALDRAADARKAIEQNNKEVVQQLVEEMLKLPPEQFELLALRVLQKAGYGHASIEFEHSGKSGDGGIDGWLPLDRLGLQRVYIQAKRYKETNAISPAQVREFAGAMLKRSATMGVFVTLSRYTSDAKEAARNIDRKIELMDGQALAKLMIELEIGVSHEALPPLAKLDTDFFEDL